MGILTRQSQESSCNATGGSWRATTLDLNYHNNMPPITRALPTMQPIPIPAHAHSLLLYPLLLCTCISFIVPIEPLFRFATPGCPVVWLRCVSLILIGSAPNLIWNTYRCTAYWTLKPHRLAILQCRFTNFLLSTTASFPQPRCPEIRFAAPPTDQRLASLPIAPAFFLTAYGKLHLVLRILPPRNWCPYPAVMLPRPPAFLCLHDFFSRSPRRIRTVRPYQGPVDSTRCSYFAFEVSLTCCLCLFILLTAGPDCGTCPKTSGRPAVEGSDGIPAFETGSSSHPRPIHLLQDFLLLRSTPIRLPVYFAGARTRQALVTNC